MDDPIKRVIMLYDDGFGESNNCLFDYRPYEFKMTEEEKNEMETIQKAYSENQQRVKDAIENLTAIREKTYAPSMLQPKSNL